MKLHIECLQEKTELTNKELEQLQKNNEEVN